MLLFSLNEMNDFLVPCTISGRLTPYQQNLGGNLRKNLVYFYISFSFETVRKILPQKGNLLKKTALRFSVVPMLSLKIHISLRARLGNVTHLLRVSASNLCLPRVSKCIQSTLFNIKLSLACLWLCAVMLIIRLNFESIRFLSRKLSRTSKMFAIKTFFGWTGVVKRWILQLLNFQKIYTYFLICPRTTNPTTD